MNIVFLGSVTDEKKNQELSGASVAGNKMQLNIIEHLNMQDEISVSVISVPSVAAFPIDKRIAYKEKKYVLENGCAIVEVPFLNIPLLKQLMQMISVYRMARKYGKDDTVFLAFNLYPQVGSALSRLKNKGYKTAAILADLPINDNYANQSKLIQIMNHMTEKYIAAENQLIVLNENAIRKYNPCANYIVMEGGCEEFNEGVTDLLPNEKNIVFCGRLIEYNGIIELLGAMKYVKDSNIKLDIYGSGPLKNIVEDFARNDSRIRFHGSVDNKLMMEIQKRAWLLINPRPINDPISQVTFPSKMFEYLISGTPVLTTKLIGFTEEYDKLMYYCVSDKAEGIAESINNIALMPQQELKEKAIITRKYILMNKNWKNQARRISEFLEEME